LTENRDPAFVQAGASPARGRASLTSEVQGNRMTMAEHPTTREFEEHWQTYRGFIRGSIAIVLACVYVMVALISVAFGSALPVFLAFAGIIVGIIAIAIDLRSGAQRWPLSLGVLVLFALITALNLS
jgi:hypothetical protein